MPNNAVYSVFLKEKITLNVFFLNLFEINLTKKNALICVFSCLFLKRGLERVISSVIFFPGSRKNSSWLWMSNSAFLNT